MRSLPVVLIGSGAHSSCCSSNRHCSLL